MFVGKTKLAITVRQALRKIRATNSNALIIGEDGLGKKNLAKSLHKHGHNALSELSSLDCQDNEALKKHFENNFEDLKLSEKGTIILEHIEKLDIQGQIHIYQHLKYSSKRIICTSKYDLEMMVNNEILIKEFFILISKFYIHLIPLRNRKDDIMTIANYFLLMEGEKRNLKNMVFSEKTKSDFLEYLWPGNIKEMESTIKKFFMIEAPRDELENKELNISTPKSSRKQSFATSLIQLACKLSEHSDASIHYKTHNNIISELLKNFKNAS